MHDPWPIVDSVAGVFLIILIGAFARKIRWLNQESDKSLANLTTNVLLPAYFVQKILLADHPGITEQFWAAPLWGFATTTLGFLISYLVAKKIGPKIGLVSDGSQRVFALCVGICNFGFIPLPLAEQYFPNALVDLILHNVGVNLALWSIGIVIISGSLRSGWRKAVLNPPFLSVVFAMLCEQQGVAETIPPFAKAVLESVGTCAIPMGLILSGAIMVDFLNEASWRGSFRICFAAISLRQFLFPLLMLTACTLLSRSDTIRQVILLQAAMPTAILPIVIVKLYDHDMETALRVVIVSSMVGVVTIPVWLMLGAEWI